MLRKLIILLLFFQGFALVGQEMLGVKNSNYSGVYGISLNPSSMVTSRLYMDFNLIGVQGYVANNYIYVQRDEFITIVRDRIAPVYYTAEHEKRNFNIYRNNESKSGFQNANVLGPSGMVVLGKHALGITSKFRSVSSFHDLPPEMGIFIYEAIDYEFQHNIDYSHDKPINVSSMAWMELGFSYAINFHRQKWNSWSAGITVKPLFGMAGMYASIDNLNYVVHSDDSATVYNASLEYGMSLPVDYVSNQYQNALDVRGTGVGFDMGISFQKTEKGHSTTMYSEICEPPFEEYNYKIGFSILDLGFIKFKENALKEVYESTSTEWYEPYDTLDFGSVKNVLGKLKDYLIDNAEVTESAQEFTMYLPTTLSVQVDVKLKKSFYVNLTGYYGVQLGKAAVYRPSLISIAPRYETARWEVSMPISFSEWEFEKPRIGFSVRYGNVFVGFDRLNTMLGVNNFDGIDFYAGIRLNLSNAFKMNFVKGNCGMKRMYNIETFDYRNF